MNSFFVKMLVCSKISLKLSDASFLHFSTFQQVEWERYSMCLLHLTDSHSHVIVVVSSLILNKNSQKLLLSQDPSHHRSRICEHNKRSDSEFCFFWGFLDFLRQMCPECCDGLSNKCNKCRKTQACRHTQTQRHTQF